MRPGTRSKLMSSTARLAANDFPRLTALTAGGASASRFVPRASSAMLRSSSSGWGVPSVVSANSTRGEIIGNGPSHVGSGDREAGLGTGTLDGMARRDRIVLLGVLGVGVFLAGLELMVTAVALPSILRDLSSLTDLRHAAWIVNGYLLVYVVAMPLAGRMTDLWGARRPFYLGLIAFTVGSALAGAAPTLDLLIAARLVQALGGGILVPVGTAAASHLFAGHARA